MLSMLEGVPVGANTAQQQALQALVYKMADVGDKVAESLKQLPTTQLECAQWIGNALLILREWRMIVRQTITGLHGQIAELSLEVEQLKKSHLPPSPDYIQTELHFVTHSEKFRAVQKISYHTWRGFRGVREDIFRTAVETMLFDIIKEKPELFVDTVEQAVSVLRRHQDRLAAAEASDILPCPHCCGSGAILSNR